MAHSRVRRPAGYSPAWASAPSNPLTFDLNTSNATESRLVSVALQGMWNDIGVKVRLLPYDSQIHYAMLRKRDFDATWAGWIADYRDPKNYLTLFQTATTDLNYGGYSNPAFDALVTSFGPGARRGGARGAVAAAAEQILLDDVAVAPGYLGVTRNLVSPQVKGFATNNVNIHRSPLSPPLHPQRQDRLMRAAAIVFAGVFRNAPLRCVRLGGADRAQPRQRDRAQEPRPAFHRRPQRVRRSTADLLTGLCDDGRAPTPALFPAPRRAGATSTDGKSWTFHLRDHVWSDGEGRSVTAQDFVCSRGNACSILKPAPPVLLYNLWVVKNAHADQLGKRYRRRALVRYRDAPDDQTWLVARSRASRRLSPRIC